MIGRADIEGSKSNVAMNAWLPQASYPESARRCGWPWPICVILFRPDLFAPDQPERHTLIALRESNFSDTRGFLAAEVRVPTSVALISVFSLKQPREAKNENFCYRSSGAQSRPAQRPDKRNFCSIIFRFQLKTAARSKKRRFMLQKLGAQQTTTPNFCSINFRF